MDGRYPREHKKYFKPSLLASGKVIDMGKGSVTKYFFLVLILRLLRPVFPFIIIEPIISSAACPICLRVSGLFADVNRRSQLRVTG
jgi:hypothetical protein